MRGLREVDHQVTRAQRVRRHLPQLPPLFLRRPRNDPARLRPGLRGEPRAVEGVRPLRAPHVRLADLVDRVLHRLAARLGRRPCRGQRPRGDQGALGLLRVPLFEPGQLGELGAGELGQHRLDGLQPRPDRVPLLLLLRGQHLLPVEDLAGLGRQLVGVLLGAGEPLHRRRPPGRRAPDHMLLVQEVFGVPGQQEPHVRGEVGPALVLLPGQPPRLVAAVGQRGPGGDESDVELLRLCRALLQLGGGPVVRLGGLLGLLVQLPQLGQELGDAPVRTRGRGPRSGRHGRGGRRRGHDERGQGGGADRTQDSA